MYCHATWCGCCCPMGRVTENEIGVEGAASLSQALKCCSQLRVLDLRGELLVVCLRYSEVRWSMVGSQGRCCCCVAMGVFMVCLQFCG